MTRVSMMTVAAVAVALMLPAAPSFAAKKVSVCHNAALSATDQADCSHQLAMAKTKSDKAKVRQDFQAKVDMAKKAK